MSILRILHFSDSHVRPDALEEIQRCHATILETAIDRRPDLIIHSGDVFDSRDVRAGSDAAIWVTGFFRRLSDIAPVIVVRGTPSHDGQAPKLLANVGGNYQVMVVDYPVQLAFERGFKGYELCSFGPTDMPVNKSTDAIITAWPAPTKEFFKTDAGIAQSDQEIGQAMTAAFAGQGGAASQYDCPHILVGHWNVTGAFVSGSERLTGVDIEVSVDQMGYAQADLVCLGHIHKAQQVGSAPVFFAGSPQINAWGEMDTKGFYLHTIYTDDMPEAGTVCTVESEFITTPTTRRIRFQFDATTPDFEAPAIGHTGDFYGGAIIRIDLKVWADEADKWTNFAVQQRDWLMVGGAGEVVSNIVRVPRPNVRSANLMEKERLRDKLEERARIVGEPSMPGVLEKADMLDDMNADELTAAVANGYDSEVAA